jgi:hypothetical protein
MDSDRDNKILLCEFETAGIACGQPLDSVERLFSKLDPDGKGYITALDFGRLECKAEIDVFTTKYARQFLGLPGPASTAQQCAQYLEGGGPTQLKKVSTLPNAIKCVRFNAALRGSHGASGSSVIHDAFRFIDTDGTGVLDREELRDGR